MSLNTTTLGGILKRAYTDDAIRIMYHSDTILMDKMGTAPEVLGGDSTRFAADVEGDESFAFVAEGQAIPAAANQNVQQPSITAVQLLGQVVITGLGWAKSQNAEHSFANAFSYNLQRKMANMGRYKEGALFRDGTGQLATVNEPSSVPDTTSGNLNVDGFGTTFLKVGQSLDFFSTSNVKQATAKLTAIDLANSAITLDVDISSSITDNSKIFLAGTQQSGSIATREVNGLANQLVGAGSTWNGLSTTTYPNLQSNIVDAGSAALTEDIVQRLVDRIQRRAGVNAISGGYSIVLNTEQRRRMLDLVRAMKMFSGLSLDAGYSDLAFNGMPVMLANQCPGNVLYVLDPMDYQNFYTPKGPMHISDDDGLPIKPLSGYDSFVTVIRDYSQSAVRRPVAHGRIESLDTPTL